MGKPRSPASLPPQHPPKMGGCFVVVRYADRLPPFTSLCSLSRPSGYLFAILSSKGQKRILRNLKKLRLHGKKMRQALRNLKFQSLLACCLTCSQSLRPLRCVESQAIRIGRSEVVCTGPSSALPSW